MTGKVVVPGKRLSQPTLPAEEKEVPEPAARAGQAVRSGWRQRSCWCALWLGLFVWQGVQTLSLFGPEPLATLCDKRPIVSGAHPLHLYHAALGAQALRERGWCCCYDPYYQAGYPKTPLFDSGCRPAELLLALVGRAYDPAVYKLGLALWCFVAVPGLLALAALAAGLGRGAWAATVLGLLVFWGDPGRRMLEAGQVDVLLAGLASLAHVGLLLAFDRGANLWSALGLLLTAGLGWLAQPGCFGLMIILFLIYYISVGPRHGRLSWHVLLWGSELGGLAGNLFWLEDAVKYWWVRAPLPPVEGLVPHRTLRSLWEAPLWGDAADRALALLLLLATLLGVLVLNSRRQRAAARLLGVGAVGLVSLAILGISWEPAGRLHAAELLVPGLWFACLAAVPAGQFLLALLARGLRGWGRTALVSALLGPILLALLGADLVTLAERLGGTTPLEIGLNPERQALVESLLRHTGPEARILWEDQPQACTASRWPALLALLTGRAFLGGLDADGCLEHSHVGLRRQQLEDRPLEVWKDEELADYCRRYNVGWVVAWSPAAQARFRAWKNGVQELAQLQVDGQSGCLFRVRRPSYSYALKGKADVVALDGRRICLANVVPEEGQVVLSWHYQAGLRASPSRVQVERQPNPLGLLDLVRLRVASPVACVTLSWDE
jgi:hypothetical protein